MATESANVVSAQGRLDLEILAVEDGRARRVSDCLATEQALEIRVAGADPVITMRTPGHDLELTAGLLLSEGVLHHRRELIALRHWMGRADTVHVMVKSLAADVGRKLARSSLSNSACGVCGKARLNLESLRAQPRLEAGPRVDMATILALPERLRRSQHLFAQTGGLHAAALFDAHGDLCAVREDVGRHNAMDKLMGWALLNDRLPLADHIVLLSGRASFELMQKAIMAGAPLVCAVSAPSSYAVDLAREFDVTLVGFLRHRSFNIYSAPERILHRVARQVARPTTGDRHASRRVS